MTKAKAKNKVSEIPVNVLNLETVKKESVQKFAQILATVQLDGKDYSMMIDTKFSNTKVNALLDDLNKYFAQGMNKTELLDYASTYISLLIMKHFSSIDVPDDIDEALTMMKDLVDLQWFAPIIDAFDENEIVQLFEKIYLAVAQMEQAMTEASNISDEQLAQLEKSEAALKLKEELQKEQEDLKE